jgi:hypothetical protein
MSGTVLYYTLLLYVCLWFIIALAIYTGMHNKSICTWYTVVIVPDVVGRGYHCTSDGRILGWSIHIISEHLSRSKVICAEKISINDRFYKSHARLKFTLVAAYNIHVVCLIYHFYNYLMSLKVRTVSHHVPEDEKPDDL